jgi:hypothetical protein
MACPSCSTPVASNARVCPKCGHRFTHPFVMIVAALFVLLLIGAITQGGMEKSRSAAAPSKTPQQIEDDNYESATGACMLWADKNGPFPMGDLVDEFQLPRRKKDPKEVYRAGLHYRAKSNGVLMRADCSTLKMKDGKIMILEARARVGQ